MFLDCVFGIREVEVSVNGIDKQKQGSSEANVTLKGTVEEVGQLDSEMLPVAVLGAATAIQWLWAGSASVLSVNNIYTAMYTYRKRNRVDKDLVDAFVRSRIVALEESAMHEKNDDALVEIFSVDSLSALLTFRDTSTRIADMCEADGWNASSAALRRHADNAHEVYDTMRDQVCKGLAQEIREQSQRASAVAEKYWREVPRQASPGITPFHYTLYYETARKRHKVYNRDVFNEYDIGIAPSDEIDLEDFRRDCQPQAFESCWDGSVDIAGEHTSSASHDPRTEAFENTTDKVKLLLQGFEDAECPREVFDGCAHKAMLCTHGARSMLKALETGWRTKEAAAKAAALSPAEKSKTLWFVNALERFTGSAIKDAAGKVGLVNLVGTIAQLLYRFRASIYNLLNAKGWETQAAKLIWEAFWTGGVRKQGNFIQRFVGEKMMSYAAGQVPGALAGIAKSQIPSMAGWMLSFSFLAIKRSEAVSIENACKSAADALRNADYLHEEDDGEDEGGIGDGEEKKATVDMEEAVQVARRSAMETIAIMGEHDLELD